MGLLSGSIGSIKAMERGCKAGENREINLVKKLYFLSIGDEYRTSCLAPS
jgi:hypothetical protein